MRGLPHFNFPAFDAARDFLKSLNWDVISPADLDREAGMDPLHNLTPDSFTEEHSRAAIKRDIDALMVCDAIAMLPGWENSKGARVEHALAVYLNLTILDATNGQPL